MFILTVALLVLRGPEAVHGGVRLGLVEVENGAFSASASRFDLAVSPDGAHVYFTLSDIFATTGDRVFVFSRNPVSGTLTLVQSLGPIPGALMITSDIAISPDGAHVYVASWCRSAIAPLCLEPTNDDSAIAVFDRDAVTGELTFVDAVDQSDGLAGRWIAISPDGAHVYGEPTVFERDALTGELTPVQQVVPPLGSRRRVSPDGKHLYSINGYGVGAYTRDAISGELTLIAEVPINSNNPLQGLQDITIPPDGRHVYVVERTNESPSVRAYERDPASGELRLVSTLRNPSPGVEAANYPVALATSPDGSTIYIANDLDLNGKLATYRRDPTTGILALSEALDAPSNYFHYTRIAVAPGGMHVYAAGDGTVGPSGGVIAVYEVLPSPCAAAPLSGCRSSVESGKGKIDIRNDAPNSRDRLRWNWVKGEATAVGAFGDPGATTQYTFCLYDGPGTLVMSALAPAGELCGTPPCWKSVSGGFKYQDPFRTPDGLSTIRLKAGDLGKTKIKLKGRRLTLDPPMLPLTGPVTAQLQASTGECWEARYDNLIIRNNATQFQARPD